MYRKHTITALLSLLCVVSGITAAESRHYEVYQPTITKSFVYNPADGPLNYNHDSSIEYFQGRFYAGWNGNTNMWEGRPGQLNYWAVSEDGMNWSEFREFEGVPVFGSPGWQTEWQPNMFNYHDKELWCLWTRAGGFIHSVLTDPNEGWTHRTILEGIEIDGSGFSIFPTQEPTMLYDGSVIVPVSFREYEPTVGSRRWFAGLLKTSDSGKTWTMPEGALLAHPDGAAERTLWEPMFVEQTDGRIRMFVRNEVATAPTHKKLLTAVGNKDATEFERLYYSPIRTLCSRMWLGQIGQRRIMLHHDTVSSIHHTDRINVALYSSRTGRDDFIAGCGLVGDELIIAYPQAVIRPDAMYMIYTAQSAPRAIKVAKVSPLPKEDTYYIFPRSPHRALADDNLPRVTPDAITLTPGNRLMLTELLAPDQPLGLSFWVRPHQGFQGEIVSVISGGNDVFTVGRDAGGTLTVRCDTDETPKATSLMLADTGRWSFVTMSWEPDSAELSIAVDAQSRWTRSLKEAPEGLLRVALRATAVPMDIGDVGVFATALNASHQRRLMNGRARSYGSEIQPGAIADPGAAIATFHPGERTAAEASSFRLTETAGDNTTTYGQIEGYAYHGSVTSTKVNTLGSASVTVTGWTRQVDDSQGVFVNALDDSGRRGFSARLEWHDFFTVRINGQEHYLHDTDAPRNRHAHPRDNNYYFFAFVIDNEQGNILYWKDDGLHDGRVSFEPGQDLSSGMPISFMKPMPMDAARLHWIFYGGVRDIRVYDETLSAAQIRTDYNRYAAMVDTEPSSEPVAEPPAVFCRLDPSLYGDPDRFVLPDAPVAMGVEHLKDDGQDLLLFRGNSSAGLDVDGFWPYEGDRLTLTVPVRVDSPIVSDELRFLSIGSEGRILLALRRQDRDTLHLRVDGRWHTAGNFKLGHWQTLKLTVDKDRVIVYSESDEVLASVHCRDVSPRVYLGDGYPEAYIAPADGFWVDVAGVSSTVNRVRKDGD